MLIRSSCFNSFIWHVGSIDGFHGSVAGDGAAAGEVVVVVAVVDDVDVNP